jgi:hypothetical protein
LFHYITIRSDSKTVIAVRGGRRGRYVACWRRRCLNCLDFRRREDSISHYIADFQKKSDFCQKQGKTIWLFHYAWLSKKCRRKSRHAQSAKAGIHCFYSGHIFKNDKIALIAMDSRSSISGARLDKNVDKLII